MKHLCLGLSLLIILMLFSGCIIPYQGERPFDYPPARWISETPDMWFDVISPIDQSVRLELYGQLQLSEQPIKIIVSFDYTNRIFIRDSSSSIGLEGTCRFYPDRLIVTVNKENDTLLKGQYDTIIFVRNASAETT